MAINLSDIYDSDITDDTVLSGDLSGSLPSPTVIAVQGVGIPSTGYADGLAWRYNSGSMELVTMIVETTNFTGDVSGNQASGLSVRGIDGVGVEIASPIDGHGIVYNGSHFENRMLEQRDIHSLSANGVSKQVSMQEIFTDTETAAFSLTLHSGNLGDVVYIHDDGSHWGDNSLTIVPNALSNINGDTAGVTADVAGLSLKLVRLTDGWRMFVL